MKSATPYLIPQWPAPQNIISFTTLRFGGFSSTPYESFNLGDHVGDRSNHVLKNRQQLINDWGLSPDVPWLTQIHGTQVIEFNQNSTDMKGDAIISRQPQTPCAVLTADCLPILLCHRKGNEIAAIHAGWRGLLNGIVENTVAKMHSAPTDIIAWLGPAISKHAFEINSDIKNQFIDKNPQNKN